MKISYNHSPSLHLTRVTCGAPYTDFPEIHKAMTASLAQSSLTLIKFSEFLVPFYKQ